MRSKFPDTLGGDGRPISAPLTILALVGCWFVVNDLIGGIRGGGIFPLLSALTGGGAASVDIEEDALQTIFIGLVGLVVGALVRLLRPNLQKSSIWVVIVCVMLFGGIGVGISTVSAPPPR